MIANILKMAQLLVRKLDDSLVRRLKKRARERGVSAEEEHRRILAEALAPETASLGAFLLSPEGEAAPEVDLVLDRSRSAETRDTGF